MPRIFLVLMRIGRHDLRTLWLALRHPRRPLWLIPALIALGIWFVSPLTFAIPLLGVIDDLVLVPMALHFLLKRLPPEIHAQAR